MVFPVVVYGCESWTVKKAECRDLITDLNIAKDDYQVKVVTCPEAEFDATYQEYMHELKSIGIDTIIDERTEYYEGKQ